MRPRGSHFGQEDVPVLHRWRRRRRAGTDAERALRDDLLRFRAFFDDNPHAAFTLTPDGVFCDANATTQEHTGYSREQLLGLRFDEIVHGDRLPHAYDTFAAVMSGEAQKVQTVVRHHDGRAIDLNVTLVPVVVDGVVLCVQGLAEDMTTENAVLRALEEARRGAEAADAAKSDFLTNTSHEFRTPLTSLLAAAELLGDRDLGPDDRRLVELVQRAGLRLLALVDDVLDASRLTTGHVHLDVEQVRLGDVLDAVARVADPEARERGIGFRRVVADSAPAVLQGDAHRLERVLAHLVGNALKFTDSGGVTLRVRGDVGSAGPTVVFDVEDTGTGFPETRLESLFRPFAQLDPTATRRHGGAGLGLTISRQLVALMGGRLSATSTLGVGSTFTLEVPVAAPATRPEPA